MLGVVTSLGCQYRRGEALQTNSEWCGLCNLCWQWRKLPADYYPNYLNEVNCDHNDDGCLSGIWHLGSDGLVFFHRRPSITPLTHTFFRIRRMQANNEDDQCDETEWRWLGKRVNWYHYWVWMSSWNWFIIAWLSGQMIIMIQNFFLRVCIIVWSYSHIVSVCGINLFHLTMGLLIVSCKILKQIFKFWANENWNRVDIIRQIWYIKNENKALYHEDYVDWEAYIIK